MVPVTKSKYRRLPDLCLLALFGQMPLKDRLSAHKVNSRWGQLVREASQFVNSLTVAVTDTFNDTELLMEDVEAVINHTSIASNPSVKLLTKNDGSTPLYPLDRLTKLNCLHFSNGTLDFTTVKQILNIFFATTEFTFFVYSEENNKQQENRKTLRIIEKMLKDHQWCRQLVSFKLFGQELDLYPRVIKAINSLSALRHLTIQLNGPFYMGDLPILGQLKELNIRCVWTYVNMNNFVRALHRHATDNGDLRIDLEQILHVHFFGGFSDHLCDRMVRLSDIPLEIENLSAVCNLFRSLTSLSLIDDAPSRQLFSHLSELHHLVHLQLELSFTDLPSDFDESLLPEGQLKSVKALDLYLVITSHSQLQWLNFPWTLPNIEAIYLCGIKCKSCNIKTLSTYSDESKLDTVRKCLCSALQVFKQTGVPLTRIIYRKPDGEIGTAEEVLPPPEV